MKKIYFYLISVIILIISFIFDAQISVFFTGYRSDILTSIALFINYIQWYILFGVILIVILLRKEYKKFPALFISLILYLVFTNLIKIVVARPRPYVNLNNSIIQSDNPYKSFPSGHATSMFTLLPFLTFIDYLWIFLSIIVMLSRVYIGVHYLSDVIAGMLLGLIIGELSLYLVKKLKFKSNRKL